VKQSNLGRDGRAPRQKIATLRDPQAGRADESRVDSPHSDSCGAGCSIAHGIAMLIDILAREALRMMIAEHLAWQAGDDLRGQNVGGEVTHTWRTKLRQEAL
jgi:hypothetical protein